MTVQAVAAAAAATLLASGVAPSACAFVQRDWSLLHLQGGIGGAIVQPTGTLRVRPPRPRPRPRRRRRPQLSSVAGKCTIISASQQASSNAEAITTGDSEAPTSLTSSSSGSEDEDRTVLNPLTNRRIKQQKLGRGGVRGTTKWHEFMLERGGYIACNGRLVPIDLEALEVWAKGGQQRDTDGADNAGYDACGLEDEDWYPLAPKVESILEVHGNGAVAEEVPHINELLFAHKPSGLLTLPGIGPDKADCLASRVKSWLGSTTEGQAMQRHLSMREISNRVEGGRPTARKAAKKKKKKKKKQPFQPRPCHRLDLDTSGVVAIGLTPDALRAASILFQNRCVQKTYVALVAGHLEEDSGTIDYPIGKVGTEEGYNKWACALPLDMKSPTEQLTFVEGSVREARTEWRVSARLTVPVNGDARCHVGEGPDEVARYTRVELKPLTGRGHQLRLHMASIGHPMLGDTLHAPSVVAAVAPRLCLHAETLVIQGWGDEIECCSASSAAPF